ncbi:biliverdin-producing heme oxygenase [Hoeflea olei]|uniref:Heme oxygenase n=1 Tax=Hoeflea olei TaxID=1480615 RepID=A0A1C1YY74_9HYPH|nr:biliverdin-producing heme oxygenase [Hoeflea olei]OCW58369.1 heme oxygenase [Hoeflea olei]
MTHETLETQAEAGEVGRAKRLKRATHSTHERLDQAIMAREPFADRERYGRFLAVQHRFHAEIDPLFGHPELQALLPDLEERRRLDLIRQDMADLGMASPTLTPGRAEPLPGIAVALGWLYVAEGSNLGAAFLLKEAAKLGLSQAFGARHLAPAPEGRGLHWRTFTAALDAVALPEADEARVVAGAEQAFRRVHALVGDVFG